LSQADIVCEICGKSVTINKVDGKLCISCWRNARLVKRKARLRDSLDHCLIYYSNENLSNKELKLIKDAVFEINKTQ